MTVFYYKIAKFVNQHNKSFRSCNTWCNTTDSRLKCFNPDKAPDVIINVQSTVESGVSEIQIETDCKLKSHVKVVHVKPSTSSELTPVETLDFRDTTLLEDNTSQSSRVISPSPSEKSFILQLGKTQKRLQLQEKLVKILLVTILAFKVCWLPFAVYSVLETLDLHASDSSSFPLVAVWLAFSNTICNPIIYAFLNEQFRKSFRDTLRALCRVSSPAVEPG